LFAHGDELKIKGKPAEGLVWVREKKGNKRKGRNRRKNRWISDKPAIAPSPYPPKDPVTWRYRKATAITQENKQKRTNQQPGTA